MLPREHCDIPFHRASQHSFVSIDRACMWMTTGDHFSFLSSHILTRSHDHHSHRNGHVRIDAESQVILLQTLSRNQCWRLSKSANNFGARDGQVFPGSNVEGNPFPTPRIDLEFYCGKCFHLRVLCYAILIAVATELATDEIFLG